MKGNFLLLLSISFVCIGALVIPAPKKKALAGRTVLVVLDGFRWDYAERELAVNEESLPAFARFKSEGVRAEYVQPIFPSVSFPSWTTIATGLYPESHGITGNYMYDPETREEFSLNQVGLPDDSTDDLRWWNQHIPIWSDATKQGLRTSSYYFSRCDVPFNIDGEDVLPDKCVPYSNALTILFRYLEIALQNAFTDLLLGFDFVIVYNSVIDELGHLQGPDSTEIRDMVVNVDAAINEFLILLEDAGLLQDTNVMIVSDHGMSDSAGLRLQKLAEFTDPENFEKVVDFGPFTHIALTDAANVQQVVADLKAWEDVDVYAKSDIPDHLHFRDNDLILDVLVVTKGEALILQDEEYPQDYLPRPTPGLSRGFHGFDDTSPSANDYESGPFADVRGIFYAMGPSFAPGYVNPWIKQVDAYQVIATMLGIEARPNNGTFSRVEGMFSDIAKNR